MTTVCKFDYDVVLSSFVWSYDKPDLFGYPLPLTDKAKQMLSEYDTATGTMYSKYAITNKI
jgi:hypothetical protein